MATVAAVRKQLGMYLSRLMQIIHVEMKSIGRDARYPIVNAIPFIPQIIIPRCMSM